jgi:hypothetical protein
MAGEKKDKGKPFYLYALLHKGKEIDLSQPQGT